MRLLGVIAALVLAPCLAAAQPAARSAVMEHFTAYRAALEADDLPAAETAAAAALAASEARDGDGGRTPVLLYNLASVQLDLGKHGDAWKAARRARALAEARPDAGLDPLLAGMLAGRAEIAFDAVDETPILAGQLALAMERPLSAQEIYPAALDLIEWSAAHERHDILRAAWAAAASSVEASGLPENFARAQARIGEGAAILMDEATRHRHRPSARLTEDGVREAHGALYEARQLLAPLIEQDLPNGELTAAQRTYALALAWDGALRAKALTDHQPEPRDPGEAEGDADGVTELEGGPMLDTRPRCLVRTEAPRFVFPSDAELERAIGAVVVRLVVDAEGRVVREDVAARVGSELFAEEVTRRRGWRVHRREDSPPDCRMQMTVLRTVTFLLR